MSNPLDLDAFDPSSVRVEPEVPGLRIDAGGDSLIIRGRTKGHATYRVTLPKTLRDTFGQSLGRTETLTFRVGEADPRFLGHRRRPPRVQAWLQATRMKRAHEVSDSERGAKVTSLYRSCARSSHVFVIIPVMRSLHIGAKFTSSYRSCVRHEFVEGICR